MNKINLPQAAKLTSPNPVSVVCTMKPDGSTNLATVSWWTYLSFNPNMIAYAMAKTSYSGEMVRNTKKVILTIPGAEIADAVMGRGSTMGRSMDKAEKSGIGIFSFFQYRSPPFQAAYRTTEKLQSIFSSGNLLFFFLLIFLNIVLSMYFS